MRPSIQIPTFLRGLGQTPILAVTLVAAQFVLAPPSSAQWHGARTMAVEIGLVVLLLTLLCLHALLLWALVSCLRGPNPFAFQSLLMLGVGVLAADVVTAQVTDQRRMIFLVALLLSGAMVCLWGRLD